MRKKVTIYCLKLHNFLYKLISKLSFEKGIHPKHRIINYHKFFLDNINSEDVVLDIGCGNGFLTFDIAKKAKKVVALEKNSSYLKEAEKKNSSSNIRYFLCDATSYRSEERFSVLILSNVLEHIENRIDFLRNIKRFSEKILIRVPMINRDWITLYKKELGVEWRLDKTHFTEYTLLSFQEELKCAGLMIKEYSV